MKTINDFAMMEPMKYYNNEDTGNKKRQAMLDNNGNEYIATEKHDGDWGMFIHYSKDNNLIRSRSISKVTGVYGDYTAKLPHLCEEMNNWPDNTVVLAEICWNEYGTNANTVGTILRCLPAKAVERQKDKKLNGLVFDMLMDGGEDLTSIPYEQRLARIHNDFGMHDSCYFKPTQVFFTDFAAAADDIISRGGEGVVIQKKSNPYMPGTRTAWKTLKLKQSLPSAEYRVIGTINPNKLYEGDCPATWKYWMEETNEGTMFINRDYEEELFITEQRLGNKLIPITKPYYMGWKNGITITLPSGLETDITSGLTDADREWLATPEAVKAIAVGNVYAEVKAMSVNDLGKLRHGYLVRLRVLEDGVCDNE